MHRENYGLWILGWQLPSPFVSHSIYGLSVFDYFIVMTAICDKWMDNYGLLYDIWAVWAMAHLGWVFGKKTEKIYVNRPFSTLFELLYDLLMKSQLYPLFWLWVNVLQFAMSSGWIQKIDEWIHFFCFISVNWWILMEMHEKLELEKNSRRTQLTRNYY